MKVHHYIQAKLEEKYTNLEKSNHNYMQAKTRRELHEFREVEWSKKLAPSFDVLIKKSLDKEALVWKRI